jgi:DNA-binding HxlR family transcriptional regulator
MDTHKIGINKRYGCPVEVTLEVISGKWKCVVLWWLRSQPKRFSELMQLIPGLTQKVLTTQLRELEADGLILREAYREKPPRVEYSLTAAGKTLRPLVDLMCEWGKSRLPQFQLGFLKLQGLHILLVTDLLVWSDRLSQELAAIRGAQVTVTPSLQGWDLTRLQPDLVIVVNPGSESFTALAHQAIPAIALVMQPTDRSLAFSQGFRVVLAEPIEIVELVVTISSLTNCLG